MASDPEARPDRERRLPAWSGWLIAAAAALPALWLINRLVPRPTGLGAADGHLAACPDSPNCVCSHDTDPQHHIDPFPVTGSAEAALARVKALLADRRHVHLLDESAGYLHYEFRTPVCRFVDDVEFLADDRHPGGPVLHVRSASRLGYSDLGTNRKRLEALRAEYLRATGPGR